MRVIDKRRALDVLEQVAVIGLYVWLVLRLLPSDFSAANLYPLLILPSEALVLVLLAIRRPTDRISMSIRDWALAAGGTMAVLLVDKGGPPILGLLGPYLMVQGFVVQLGAKLSLWTSFGLVAANRGVRSGGLYKVVRHPMYAGYMISHVGFLLAAPSWWNVGAYAVGWAFLIARIFAEERILDQDIAYTAYRSTVRYRLLPGVF